MQKRLIGQRGMGAFGILIFIIFFLILMFILLAGYSRLSAQCVGEDIISCALDVVLGKKEEVKPPADAVTASGTVSREFKGAMRSVDVTLTFSPDGGTVTGSFSGDCDGSIKGTYAGGDGGAISGEGSGSCAFVLPASGSFTGTVNQANKTVVVSGKGSAAGISGEGSLTLTY